MRDGATQARSLLGLDLNSRPFALVTLQRKPPNNFSPRAFILGMSSPSQSPGSAHDVQPDDGATSETYEPEPAPTLLTMPREVLLHLCMFPSLRSIPERRSCTK